MVRAWCGNSAHSLGGRKGSVPSGGLYQCSGLCSPPCGLMLRRNAEKDWPCSITEASKQQFFRLEGQGSQLPQTELVGKKNTWIYGCLVQVFFQPSDPSVWPPTSVEVCPIVSALIFRPLKMQMWPSVRWKMGINSPLKMPSTQRQAPQRSFGNLACLKRQESGCNTLKVPFFLFFLGRDGDGNQLKW